ncbi:MAG: hypothetical protein LBJ13_03290 [Puniceicoccales bacterium]|jgi:hypothetical protein|nr:hypothetical protein [Puniceicoccales bacterium]
MFDTKQYKFNCHRKLNVLSEIFHKVRAFIKGDLERELIHGIACGILFPEQDSNQHVIIKNIARLKLLLNRSKSSINGSLLQLGYETISHMHLTFSQI